MSARRNSITGVSIGPACPSAGSLRLTQDRQDKEAPGPYA